MTVSIRVGVGYLGWRLLALSALALGQLVRRLQHTPAHGIDKVDSVALPLFPACFGVISIDGTRCQSPDFARPALRTREGIRCTPLCS